jgi:hypothetical protein
VNLLRHERARVKDGGEVVDDAVSRVSMVDIG